MSKESQVSMLLCGFQNRENIWHTETFKKPDSMEE